MIVEISTS